MVHGIKRQSHYNFLDIHIWYSLVSFKAIKTILPFICFDYHNFNSIQGQDTLVSEVSIFNSNLYNESAIHPFNELLPLGLPPALNFHFTNDRFWEVPVLNSRPPHERTGLFPLKCSVCSGLKLNTNLLNMQSSNGKYGKRLYEFTNFQDQKRTIIHNCKKG